MATAYTPGLKVTADTLVKKRRILPLQGDVIVKKGQKVSSQDIVARTDLPGSIYPKNFANLLGCTPTELPGLMVKKQGDKVNKDEIVAATQPFIKFFRVEGKSPIEGSIENVSTITGQVLFRSPPKPVEKMAFVDGEIDEIIEGVGAVVSTRATYIQGIFGIGPETWGDLVVVADSASETLTAEKITMAHQGKSF